MFFKQEFESEIREFIRREKMIPAGSHILLGVSGGADSVCLLKVLDALKKELNIRLSVLHVNHGIREEAGEDAGFVRHLCLDMNIPFYLEEVDVPSLQKEWMQTEEEAARRIRYEKFEETAAMVGADLIAVAHNADDQAETVIMNMARGAGLAGMGGIRPVRGRIIRPLLFTSRADIEKYLKQEGQAFVTDRTNLEDDHTRNRVRHLVIPLLRSQVNAGAVEHISAAAGELSAVHEYLAGRANELIAAKMSLEETAGGIRVDLASYRLQPEIMRRYILMELLARVTASRKDITRNHIMSLEDMCMKKAGSVHLDLPYGLVAERYYDILHLFRYSYSEGEGSSEDSGTDQKKDDLFMSRIIEIPEGHADEFIRSAPRGPYTKWIDYDKIRTELSFRHRQPGDRIAIDSECHTKSLSKLLTDEHIPPLSRDKLCLFADGNEIIWAVGLRMSERYKISEDTVRILEINFLHGKRN